MQVAGPAYDVLLDAWGEDFLAHGEIDMRFVGMVLAGDTIEVAVELSPGELASIEVVNTTSGQTAAVGRALHNAPSTG